MRPGMNHSADSCPELQHRIPFGLERHPLAAPESSTEPCSAREFTRNRSASVRGDTRVAWAFQLPVTHSCGVVGD
jgi:hypothetical protein